MPIHDDNGKLMILTAIKERHMIFYQLAKHLMIGHEYIIKDPSYTAYRKNTQHYVPRLTPIINKATEHVQTLDTHYLNQWNSILDHTSINWRELSHTGVMDSYTRTYILLTASITTNNTILTNQTLVNAINNVKYPIQYTDWGHYAMIPYGGPLADAFHIYQDVEELMMYYLEIELKVPPHNNDIDKSIENILNQQAYNLRNFINGIEFEI